MANLGMNIELVNGIKEGTDLGQTMLVGKDKTEFVKAEKERYIVFSSPGYKAYCPLDGTTINTNYLKHPKIATRVYIRAIAECVKVVSTYFFY